MKCVLQKKMSMQMLKINFFGKKALMPVKTNLIYCTSWRQYSAPELMLPVFQHFICLFLIYLYIEKVKFFPDDWQTLQLSVHYLHVTAAGNWQGGQIKSKLCSPRFHEKKQKERVRLQTKIPITDFWRWLDKFCRRFVRQQGLCGPTCTTVTALRNGVQRRSLCH